MNEILLDTNVFVYTCDRGEYFKMEIADDLLSKLQPLQIGYASVQSLAEFFVVTTSQIHERKPLLSTSQARRQMELYARSFKILDLTSIIAQEAARCVVEHRIPYFDAQIWASARIHQIPIIFREDFQDGQVIDGVKFVNPFSPEFEMDRWL